MCHTSKWICSQEMTLNTYQLRFQARCPVNGALIDYDWQISVEDTVVIRAEAMEAASFPDVCMHEFLADTLAGQFPGMHTLCASHGKVRITTTRQGAK
jgi:hypothetical protein